MNKFMKKIMSKKDGFTLVELIVVIAILAILAGVAVPAYSGYIKKANEAADITVCDAIKTAAVAACATKGEVTQIVVTSGTTDAVVVTVGTGTTYSLLTSIDNEKADDDFKTYFGTEINDFKTKVGNDTANTATWTKEAGWVFSKV